MKSKMMNILETDRLILCKLTLDDAPFILELLNDPAFLRFIGDRGVRTLDDARNYIANGPMDSYEKHGFGLYLTKLKDSDTPIGICGLLKRDFLEDADIGFAFLPEFTGKGYGFESAAAVMEYGKTVLGLKRIVAITAPDNVASIKLLEKLGLRFEKTARFSKDGSESKLFVPDV